MLDLPPSAAVGRKIVAEQGFADRVAFREGDVFELGLGDEEPRRGLRLQPVHHLPEERDRELAGWRARRCGPAGRW